MNLAQPSAERTVEPLPEDPIAALLSCHDRIRTLTTLSATLARAADLSPKAIAESARKLRRFFGEELPLHESDEDLSLGSRLRRAGASDEVVHALGILSRQHPDIRMMLGRMIPLWQQAEEEPASFGKISARLATATERLSGVWNVHLPLEENIVYPAARRVLSSEELLALAREIRERHGEPAR